MRWLVLQGVWQSACEAEVLPWRHAVRGGGVLGWHACLRELLMGLLAMLSTLRESRRCL